MGLGKAAEHSLPLACSRCISLARSLLSLSRSLSHSVALSLPRWGGTRAAERSPLLSCFLFIALAHSLTFFSLSRFRAFSLYRSDDGWCAGLRARRTPESLARGVALSLSLSLSLSPVHSFFLSRTRWGIRRPQSAPHAGEPRVWRCSHSCQRKLAARRRRRGRGSAARPDRESTPVFLWRAGQTPR